MIETFIFQNLNDHALVESSQMDDSAAIDYTTPMPSRKMGKIIEESEREESPQIESEEDDFETPRALKTKPIVSDNDYMETRYDVVGQDWRSEEDNRKETDYETDQLTDDLEGSESVSDLQECKIDLAKVQKQMAQKGKAKEKRAFREEVKERRAAVVKVC